MKHSIALKIFGLAVGVLIMYRARGWIAASAIFSELIQKFNDCAAVMFIARINLLKEHALGSGWDGVWRMTSK